MLSPDQKGAVAELAVTHHAARFGVRRPYNGDEVDALAVYCPELDECYLLPPTIFSGHPAIQLRIAPTRNNQKRGITWAKDFLFAATLGTLGP